MDELIDIKGFKEAFTKMDTEIVVLHRRFMALAMDYQFYRNKSFMQEDIYKLRDEVNYRLKSTRVQANVLFRHQHRTNAYLNNIYKNDKQELFKDYWPSHPLFNQAQEEISSLFDSYIYHLTSVFDYLGNLTNYIFGKKQEQAMNWNSLAKSTRDSNNDFSRKSFAKTIVEIDNQFVIKLYSHRSALIHQRSDVFDSRKYVTKDDIFFCKFISTKRFNKHFVELRNIEGDKYLTIEYVVFWLFHKTATYINEILFSLKKELELTPEPINSPTIGLAGPMGTMTSPSEIYWTAIDPTNTEEY